MDRERIPGFDLNSYSWKGVALLTDRHQRLEAGHSEMAWLEKFGLIEITLSYKTLIPKTEGIPRYDPNIEDTNPLIRLLK